MIIGIPPLGPFMNVYFIDDQLIEIAPPLWTWITFYMMEKDYKRVAIGCVVFDNFSGIKPTTSSISLSECRDYQKDVSMCIMQPRIQWSVIFFNIFSTFLWSHQSNLLIMSNDFNSLQCFSIVVQNNNSSHASKLATNVSLTLVYF